VKIKQLGLPVLVMSTIFLLSGCDIKSINRSEVNDQGQINNQTNGTVNPSGQYSINELLTMNKPMKCSWKESTTGDKDVNNIIYINGKKFYQDVTMGDLGHSFTIYDGDYLYIWSDFNNVASKMKNTEAKTNLKTGQAGGGMEQKKDFICEKWTVDNSVFIPPKDKDFKDVTEEMNQAVEGWEKMVLKNPNNKCVIYARTRRMRKLKPPVLKTRSVTSNSFKKTVEIYWNQSVRKLTSGRIDVL